MVEDLKGKTFGKVLVIGLDNVYTQPSGRKRYMWKCRCECGKEFVSRTAEIKKITSCGCERDKDNAIRQTKHSEAKTRLYQIYYSMRIRCENPKASGYLRYGGRGIRVCDEWVNDNTSFFKWAKENGFDENNYRMSLERIDPNGNYEPSNCKWILIEEQSQNRRNTIRMGNISLAEFCRRANLNYASVKSRYRLTGDIVYAIGLSEHPLQQAHKRDNL